MSIKDGQDSMKRLEVFGYFLFLSLLYFGVFAVSTAVAQEKQSDEHADGVMNTFAGIMQVNSVELADLQSLTWPEISLSSPISGFHDPVQVTHAKDGSGRLFVVEEHGRIWIVKDGVVLSTPFLDIRNLVGPHHVHGIAFPPNYASKGYFYVKYTNATCNILLVRYRLTPNPDVADVSSGEIVLSFNHATGACDHSGGSPAFSPQDGYLYFSTGDGSGGGDPDNLAQDPASLLGKIIRIDTETGNPATYTIPTTNPFVGIAGYREEIWALGFRNPWRFSFDRQAGGLYIGDVGQDLYEEIDYQAAASTGGENYGWRIMEGNHCFNPSTCSSTGLVLPVVEYDHSEGCSVTGGFVYRGVTYPGMQGIYFYGDYCTGAIWGLRQDGSVWQRTFLTDTTLSIVSFGEDEDGELFVVDHKGGAIYRIQGIPPVPTDLAITKSDSPDPVAANGLLTYTIQVTNNASAEATGMIVTDTLPANVNFISATGSCSTSGNVVTCWIPGLAAGSTTTITIIVKPPASGIVSNTASVIGNEPDPVMTNNSVSQNTIVVESVQFSATSYSVAENGGTATITVTRTGTGVVSVNYATSDNTAAAGSDYTTVSARLNFAAGEGPKSFTVPITSDSIAEGNESLNLTLSSPSGAAIGQNGRAVLIISDDDIYTSPTLHFSAVNFTGPESTATKSITVSRTGDSAGTVSVNWSAASNTATLGTDFTAPGGVLTFGPGVTSQSFTVNVTNDTAAEGNESGHLILSNPIGGSKLGVRPRATLTISDNDVSSSGFKFNNTSYTASESGSKSITISRTSSTAAQSVTFTTSNNGTAVAGTDYTAVTTTVNFAVNETSKTVSVPILPDSIVESNESVNLTLSNPTGGGTLGAQRTSVLFITDNDKNGTLQFKNTAFSVSESGPTATITVTRKGGTYGVVGISYATTNNTATSGSDYANTSGTISFAQGQTSKSFTIPILNDTSLEGAESLNLTLSNPTGGATLGQGRRAVLIITDND
jgi:uncharacterized repeat protein (TIGR01451 family)